MFKKFVLTALVAGCVTMAAMAADPAAPKIGITLGDTVSYETYNGEAAVSGPNGNDGVFNQTNLKGQVTFDLGGGIKLIPFLQERLDIKADDSSLTSSGLQFRSRFYAGLNSAIAIDPAFNIGINLEYRAQAGIGPKVAASAVSGTAVVGGVTGTSAGTTTNGTIAAGNTIVKSRFVPYLNFNGKIDVFYYDLTEDLPIYFDPTPAGATGANADNGADNSAIDLEGTYKFGFNFKLAEGLNLKIDLSEGLSFGNLLANTKADTISGGVVTSIFSNSRLKLGLAFGDIVPYIGGIFQYKQDTNLNVTKNQLFGGTAGIDLKSGNASFSLVADIGYDSAATPNALSTLVSASLSLAY